MTSGRRLLLAASLATWLLTPLLLGAARWPSWWTWIAPEQTPMTWLQSVALVLAAAGCLLLCAVLRETGSGHTRVWLLFAGGLLVLAFDERFAIHERFRDGFLAPRGVSVPFLPWVAPGDFLVLGVAVTGLFALPWIWRAVRPDRTARLTFIAGIALACVAVASDSIDPATWSVEAERLQQSAEEVVELGAGLCLLCTIALRLLGTLSERLQAPVAD